jgi:hypothetical protein
MGWDTFHGGDLIDVFKVKVEWCWGVRFIVWIVPDCKVRVFQCFFNCGSLRGIESQKLFEEIQC